jgi:hypothetical protein
MGIAGAGVDAGGGELRVVVQATEKTIPKNNHPRRPEEIMYLLVFLEISEQPPTMRCRRLSR